MKKLPRLILTDIDGVWTDGGMYYGNNSTEMKKFSTYDSAGVLFARVFEIEVGIITGENTDLLERRAQKLNIEIVHQGIKDKYSFINELLLSKNISWNELAYIGDDINDAKVLIEAGFSATPANAPDYIKQLAKINLKRCGGEGAFREFVELLIMESGNWTLLKNYILDGTFFKTK